MIRSASFRRIILSVASVCALIIFFPAFDALFRRWQEPISYYDHGIIVPFVCAWMAWREKALRPHSPAAPAANGTFFFAGLPLFVFALFLQLLGASQQITVIQGIAVVLAVWGGVLFMGGRKLFCFYRWPLLYLLLFIPVPSFFMAQLTLGMRQLSTDGASAVLHGVTALFGKPYFQVGNELNFAGHRVTIVDACSGMNTLLTMISVGLVLVYLEKSRITAFAITALLIPVAIVTNLVRILMLCFFVALNQSDFAFGVGHVPIGVVTVGSAFLFLAFGVRVPKKWKERWDKAPLQTPLISPPEKSQEGGNSSLAICTAVLAVFAVASLRIQNQAEIPTLSHHNDVMPEINLANWKAVETPLDATTYDIVGTKDAHMFRYDGAGKPVYLYWLHSENSRKIGHPPELCYRGDSYEIVERDEKTVNVNGREIPIIRMVVQRGDYRLLVYYWYRIGGVETASYLEHQIKWAWQHLNSSNENNEASMTRISTEIDGGAEDRLKQWMREALTKGA